MILSVTSVQVSWPVHTSTNFLGTLAQSDSGPRVARQGLRTTAQNFPAHTGPRHCDFLLQPKGLGTEIWCLQWIRRGSIYIRSAPAQFSQGVELCVLLWMCILACAHNTLHGSRPWADHLSLSSSHQSLFRVWRTHYALPRDIEYLACTMTCGGCGT